MAKQTVLVSDLSGEQVNPGNEAQVVINYPDARKGRIVLDVAAHEVEELASKGRRGAKRGRKPASESNGQQPEA